MKVVHHDFRLRNVLAVFQLIYLKKVKQNETKHTETSNIEHYTGYQYTTINNNIIEVITLLGMNN